MFFILFFALLALLSTLFTLYVLLLPSVYSHTKPHTKNKVIELSCDGWLARKLIQKKWGASTLPLPFFTLIFYWSHDSASDFPHRSTRVHEFQHVFQSERNLFFLVTWFKYLYELVSKRRITRSWMEAYRANVYEREAYEVTKTAVLAGEFPEWA